MTVGGGNSRGQGHYRLRGSGRLGNTASENWRATAGGREPMSGDSWSRPSTSSGDSQPQQESCRRSGPKTQGTEILQRKSYSYGERFLHRVAVKGYQLTTKEDRLKFLEIVAEFSDGIDLVFRLASENGIRSLRTALASDSSERFLSNYVLPVIMRLGKDDTCLAMCKTSLGEILKAVYSIPAIVDLMLEVVVEAQCSEDQLIGISWFILRLVSCEHAARNSQGVKKLADAVIQFGSTPARRQLLAVFSKPEGLESTTPEKDCSLVLETDKVAINDLITSGPGGRHDNDHLNFRDVNILPTIDELSSQHEPYLPIKPCSDLEEKFCGDGSELEEDRRMATKINSKLDRQFRLLREDFVGPIRETLRTREESGRMTRKKVDSIPIYADVKFDQMLGHPRPCIMVRARLPKSHYLSKARSKNKRKAYWESRMSAAVIPFNGLFALVTDGKIFCLGTVVRREIAELSEMDENGFPYPRFGLCFSEVGQADYTSDAVVRLLSFMTQRRVMPSIELVQVSSSQFAFLPFLRCLQGMTSITFAEELLLRRPSIPPEYLSNVDFQHELKFLEERDGFKYDESQAQCLSLALTNRVCLIHGGPGTGKSFIGVRMADIVYRRTNEKILCVTFTNHALDSFLKDLLAVGITEIARMGSKCTVKELEQYMVKKLEFSARRNDQSMRRQWAMTKKEMENLQSDLGEFFKTLKGAALRKGSWKQVSEFLDEDVRKQLTIPALRKGGDGRDGSYTLIGEKGKKVDDDYLWRRWISGEDRGIFRDSLKRERNAPRQKLSDPCTMDIWSMPVKQRHELSDSWLEEMTVDIREIGSQKLEQFELLQQSLKDLKSVSSRFVLCQARVIGCTTTGAAGMREILEDVKPTVVIVEEAGEVLEAHILSVLQKSTKHLILIGDHLQLRPKVANHSLGVFSGQGRDLNESMFERLLKDVGSGLQTGALHTQHRMRPEIAEILKPVYPRMQNGPRTANRQSLSGVSDNIIFIDHDRRESEHSFTNKFEVDLVICVVKYLCQNGTSPEDICVLTPYAAQLVELREALLKAHTWEIHVDERDIEEVQSSNLCGAKKDINISTENGMRNQEGNGIRIATIDNFQGEEASVIVSSLVRCNAEGRIGFLSDEGRVNVLFSRAKNAEIFIGSQQTLCNATKPEGKKMWCRILDDLEAKGHVYKSFPAQCSNHGTVAKRPLLTPDDFEDVPDGGCDAPCITSLPCGHCCPLSCHPSVDHSKVACRAEVEDICNQGHLYLRRCRTNGICKACLEIATSRKRKEKIAKKEAEALIDEESKSRKRMEELREEGENLTAKLEALEKDIEKTLQVEQAEIENERLRRDLAAQEAHKSTNIAIRSAKARKAAEQEILRKETEKERKLKKELQKAREELEIVEAEKKKESSNLSILQAKSKLQFDSLEVVKASAGSTGAPRGCGDEEHNCFQSKFQACVREKDRNGLMNLLRGTPRNDLHSKLTVLVEIPSVVKTVVGNCAAGDLPTKLPDRLQPIERGIALLRKGRLLEAYDVFLSKRKDSNEKEVTFICSTYEMLLEKLLDCASGATSPLGKIAESHQDESDPVASALRAGLGSFHSGKMNMESEKEQQQHRKAIGNALLAVTHPMAELLGVARVGLENLSKMHDLLSVLLSPLASLKKLSTSTAATDLGQYSEKALQTLRNLTGILQVKEKMAELRDLVSLNKERGIDIHKQQYNALFTGNPGTGKTTVARIYGGLLQELGVIPDGVVVETSGAKLAIGGPSELQNHLKTLDKGGVLFVDEAYQLVSSSGQMKGSAGGLALDLLLIEMEDKRGKLVVILAGYKKDMEKLLEHNEGLPSRIGYNFDFADFSDNELEEIIKSQLSSSEPKYIVADEKHVRIASRRLGKQRGTYGFGNARAVRNFLEAARSRQAGRIVRERRRGRTPKLLQLTREDLLGPKTLKVENSPALQQLGQLIGLDSIKESVQQLLVLIETNAEREEKELPLQEISLNRLFLGSPGTGKTTVAKIYGEILAELGLLSKGEVVVKNPSDFMGSFLGHSEANTNRILDSALGSVLVIDEAYGLHNPNQYANSFQTGIIDTIVAKVQGVPGDDRCVLLLGYEEQMAQFLRESNPGLARRFQLENAFRFADFTDSELLAILRAKAKKKGWILPFDVAREGVRILSRERSKPNFGNGGAVDNLLSRAVLKFEERLKRKSAAERAESRTLTVEDFISPEDEKVAEIRKDPDSLFKDLVGCREIVKMMKTFKSTVQYAQKVGRDPTEDIEMNLIFAGPPGTGKTTVAKRMGLLFHSLGILGRSDVTECSASDFSTGFIGQAGKKTREIFESALGGVLLIDEAYRLLERSGHGYMNEATDEIVNMLTEDKFKGKMVVIFAGYEEQVDEMLARVNPGLRSRVTKRVRFQPLDARNAALLLLQRLDADGYELEQEAGVALPDLMSKLTRVEGWSSGRDVATWCKRIRQECAIRESALVGGKTQVCAGVLRATWDEFVQTKTLSTGRGPRRDAGGGGPAAAAAAAADQKTSGGAGAGTGGEESGEAAGGDGDGDGDGAPAECSDADIAAALQKACVEAGYDRDDASRARAAGVLRGVAGGAAVPAEVLAAVRRQVGGADAGRVARVVRGQAAAVAQAFEAAVREEELRRARLARLAAAERAREEARERRLKAAVRRMGKCPAGFDWHRDGAWWRCNGGSHYLEQRQVDDQLGQP